MLRILKETSRSIEKEIEGGKKLFLVNGKSCSGKTKLSQEILNIYNSNKQLNPFIINGNKFCFFFSLDEFNNYEIIKIPIEKTKIIVNYKNDDINITPHKDSRAYKEIFRENKYKEKNKNFSFEKNLLIIDDCDKVMLTNLFLLDKTLRLIFNKEELFGGIHIILIGNSKINVFYDNIFSSELYNNSKNLYKDFNVFKINDVQTRFSKLHPQFDYNNQNSFLSKDKLENRAGILNQREKIFFKLRDVDTYNKAFKNKIYFSNNYEDIFYFNKNIINEINVKKYKIKPTLLFKSEDVDKKRLSYFNNCYKKLLTSITIFINMKVVFIYNIVEEEIKRGEFGIIKKINFKKNILDNEKELDALEYLKNIIVKTDKGLKTIVLRKNINRETGLSFLLLPVNIGYCVDIKYLTYINEGNLLLSKTTDIHILETCINKINNIGFKNTDLFNTIDLFTSTYTESVKNGVKV